MHNAITGAAMLAILCNGANLNAQPSTGPELYLTVRVYNAANVSAVDLYRAEQRVDIIFREAKIKISWVLVPLTSEILDHQHSEEGNPADLHLKLWTRAAIGPNIFGKDTLGFPVSTEKSNAVVIGDEVWNHAAPSFTDPGELLGLVTAYEIGHLLLPSTTHSVEGIMRDRLLTDLRDRGRTALVFTRKVSSMQNEVRRRMAVNVHPLDSELMIEVHLYNYSSVSAEQLTRAEQETARIFQRIGVAIVWRVCPPTSQERSLNQACALPDAPTRFILRLFSDSMANREPAGADVFGYALQPADESYGLVANVYADRVRELAHGGECAEVILGRIIAHELGHLLLGKNGHSPAGIMHTPWRSKDLELHRDGVMLFLPGEAKRIRTQVRARMSSGSTR